MADNVVAASRGCGIRYTSQRATNGKNSKYFQTTVMPQSCETARCALPLAYGISYQKYPKTVLSLFLISQYSFIFKRLSEYSFLTSYT